MPIKSFIFEDDTDTDDYELEAPKFLADIFESVAGAIYLDSGCSLQAVWNVYFIMLKPYFIAFKENLPVSPIKALSHLKPNSKIGMTFENILDKETDEEQVQATLTIDNETFVGASSSKNLAKTIAYKKAVRYLDTSKKIIFF